MEYDYRFDFILIGETGVGKSKMIYLFTQHALHPMPEYTVGPEVGFRTLEVNGRPIKFVIWDTAGQERYRSIVRSYYREAAGALLVYDITRRETFEQLAHWLAEARELGSSDLVITLLGTKNDLSRKRTVTHQEGEQFAKENGLSFFEVSVISGLNVENAFVTTASTILKKIRDGHLDLTQQRTSGIRLGREQISVNNQNGGCCV